MGKVGRCGNRGCSVKKLLREGKGMRKVWYFSTKELPHNKLIKDACIEVNNDEATLIVAYKEQTIRLQGEKA
jgi:hypothetical protein